MKEKPNSSEFEWVFQKTKFRVMLEDLREQMKPELREWADDVGWTYNYAIQIAVHTNREPLDYLKWVALITVLMEAYGATTVWYDEGTDTPQERLRLTEFAPLAIEYSEGDAIESELQEAPKSETTIEKVDEELPPGLMAMIRKELKIDTPEPKPEPKPEPALTLQPAVSFEEEEEEEFDDFEDWDDDEDEDEDEVADIQPVTWD